MSSQKSLEFHAKFVLALAALLLVPAVWSFFSAAYFAATTGQVLVISLGRYETARKLVAWEAGWARFVGPVFLVSGLAVWVRAKQGTTTWWVAVANTTIGCVLLLFSFWFASWYGAMFFAGFIAFVAITLFAGNRFGRPAAYAIIALVSFLFLWRIAIAS
jgi:hypothetical protein